MPDYLQKKASSPKKSPTKNKSQNMEEVIVQSLSDEELKEQLEHHNVEFGPITGSVTPYRFFNSSEQLFVI